MRFLAPSLIPTSYENAERSWSVYDVERGGNRPPATECAFSLHRAVLDNDGTPELTQLV